MKKHQDITIGFIGAGFMGYGMALNLLKKKFKVNICHHKNKKPINKLIKYGAIKKKNLIDLAKNSDLIIMCVTNTPIATKIIHKISPYIKQNIKIIDLTTHNENGSVKLYKFLKKINVDYIESPVMGGPVQAEEGVLGAIVGCEKKNFRFAKKILSNFCKNAIYFGPVGMGAKTKLVSNFLSLGTATFVIETIKVAKKLNIDLNKFYNIAKLGSGNSGALNRIADTLIKKNNYKGYIFSVNNTVKDLTYINNLLKNYPNANKLSYLAKSFYKEASKRGDGELLISELIKK